MSTNQKRFRLVRPAPYISQSWEPPGETQSLANIKHATCLCCVFISPAPRRSSYLRSAVCLASTPTFAEEFPDLVPRSVFSSWCLGFSLWEGERAERACVPSSPTDSALTPKKGGRAQVRAGQVGARSVFREPQAALRGWGRWGPLPLRRRGGDLMRKPTRSDLCGFFALEARHWDHPQIYRRGNLGGLLENKIELAEVHEISYSSYNHRSPLYFASVCKFNSPLSPTG